MDPQDYQQGEFQTRLGRGPGFSVDPETLKALYGRIYGEQLPDNTSGYNAVPTLPGPVKPQISKYSSPLDMLANKILSNLPNSPVVVQQGVPGTTIRHEAIHQFLTPESNSLGLNLSPTVNKHLKALGYSPSDYSTEAPAFAGAEPSEIGLNTTEGKDFIKQYAAYLKEIGSPEKGDRLKKYLNIK